MLANLCRSRDTIDDLKEDLGIDEPIFSGGDDSNGITVADTCDESLFEGDENLCGISLTYSEGGDINAAFQGKFGIETGDYLVHMFANGECRHVDTKEMEARGGGKGFSAEVSDGRWTWWIGADCVGQGICPDAIPDPDVWYGDNKFNVWCDDLQQSYSASGVGVQWYRFCTWICT